MAISRQPNSSIGVFDSGIGGLSVLKQLRIDFPDEGFIYFADQAYVPYGGLDESLIIERSLAICEFLIEQGVKAIVVACNTATAAAIDVLREKLSIPILGLEPAIKPAAQASCTGTIAVLATSGTLTSDRFGQLLGRVASGVNIIIQPCQGWVEAVESGAVDTEPSRVMVYNTLYPLIETGVDAIVLGCTHYPFLSKTIQEVTTELSRKRGRPEINLFHGAEGVSRQLNRILFENDLLATGKGPSQCLFYTSGVMHIPELSYLDPSFKDIILCELSDSKTPKAKYGRNETEGVFSSRKTNSTMAK